jgi:hypothetical protein
MQSTGPCLLQQLGGQRLHRQLPSAVEHADELAEAVSSRRQLYNVLYDVLYSVLYCVLWEST